jgi:polyadenylate-binding protein
MNGTVLGTKAIVVRLHEPKQMRQEKLALRFAGNGHPRAASGAASPTHSDGSDARFSPRRRASSVIGSPQSHYQSMTPERVERGRRGSGSYYQARFYS